MKKIFYNIWAYVVAGKQNSIMKKGRKPQQFIKKPIYEGGPKAMMAFIKQSLKYPKEAHEAKIKGTVRVRIRINYKGIVENTKVIAGLGYGCDEEAQRVAGLLTFKMPKNRGIKAHFHRTLNFHFRLPKKKVTKQQGLTNSTTGKKQTIQYTITQSSTDSGTIKGSIKKTNYKYKIEY